MLWNSRFRKHKPGNVNKILNLALSSIVIIVIVSLLNPSRSAAQEPLKLNPTRQFLKPQGTGESDITIWFPEGSINVPVLLTADYIPEENLPEGTTYPPEIVGQAFTFGVWSGESTALRQFEPSIVINAHYQDSDMPLSTKSADEEHLHLFMYNPGTQSWLKLCSSVNIYENVVSAALSQTTPFEENGSSLLAIAVDRTPPLDQVVDDQGTTLITLSGSDLGFQVLVDTVEVGSHFALTLLPPVSDSGSVKLLSQPVDIKGCLIDHNLRVQNSRQLTRYVKPLQIGFNYDPDTLSRAGGQANLTIVNLQDLTWVDTVEIGSRVVRDNQSINVYTSSLGTFSMAVR